MSIQDVKRAIQHCRWVISNHWEVVTTHETSTRYALIDPIIWGLGWDVNNPSQCLVEARRGQSGRIDYTMLDRHGNPVVLIEAKRVDKDIGYFEVQIARYARGIKSGSAALTDGYFWNIYDLTKRGRFKKKLVETVNIYEGQINHSARILNENLSKRKWWTPRVTKADNSIDPERVSADQVPLLIE